VVFLGKIAIGNPSAPFHQHSSKPQNFIIIALGHSSQACLRTFPAAPERGNEACGKPQAPSSVTASCCRRLREVGIKNIIILRSGRPGWCWPKHLPKQRHHRHARFVEASPSFMESCIRAVVLAVMASASLASDRRLEVSNRSFDGRLVRSRNLVTGVHKRLLRGMDQAFSLVSWLHSFLRFLSSAALASASLTILSISASERPPEAWMRICCSLFVALSWRTH